MIECELHLYLTIGKFFINSYVMIRFSQTSQEMIGVFPESFLSLFFL